VGNRDFDRAVGVVRSGYLGTHVGNIPFNKTAWVQLMLACAL
jgi:hypothetical protein